MAKAKASELKVYKIMALVSSGLFLVVAVLSGVLLATGGSSVDDSDKKAQTVVKDVREIERKWLIDTKNIPLDLAKADRFDILQTYISFSPEIRVRNINQGEQYTMTIKSDMTTDGLSRTEVEYYLSAAEYASMYAKREQGAFTIHKVRYQLPAYGYTLAIDVFQDQLEGLAYLEIEFDSEAEAKAFVAPAWVGSDVTDNKLYKNGSLARFGKPTE